jgi:hypothetical protein
MLKHRLRKQLPTFFGGEQEYNAEPVLLAPCSHDVLAVSLPVDSSANRQAIIYELEEYVPIPAE